MAKRDLILHNLGWKILSLFLAALMWMAIWSTLQRDEQRADFLQDSPVVSTRIIPVTIAVLNRAANASLFTLNPSSVEVELSGKVADLEKLQAKQINAFVDVTDAPDEKQFRRNILIQPLPDFKIKSVSPTTTTVERIALIK